METTENLFVTRTGNTHLFFADDSLLQKRAGTCDLVVLTGLQSVELALKEKRSGNLLAYESIPVKDNPHAGWKQILEETSSTSKIFRNHEFSKVTAGITFPQFTLVPESLFKPGDESLYFGRNYFPTPDINIRSQFVSAFHLYIIFGIETELEKELNHLFQDPQVFHYMQGFLAGLSISRKKSNTGQIWLNIRDGYADIVVSENKKLLLANSYPWKTNEDILYYTLFVSEQLDLNPENFNLTITGDADENSSLHKLLESYIGNICFPERPATITFDTGRIPFHHFSLLYNLSLCEL